MAEQPIVESSCGKLRGTIQNGISTFKGIPYAAPPEGAGRFMRPAKPAPWSGVRDALAYGARAMQNDDAFAIAPEILKLFAGIAELQPMSENCLFLNVWTPALDGRKRPVMFWCHGGAFISGSGSAAWYDGTNLARKGDVVVVTINHRLGAFGYLHLADVGGDACPQSGVAGMLDIVAALEWVRDNIVNFGGDPGNVTIFGESGGGAKVSVLMAMPAASGLFHKAVIQSGPGVEMASRADASETAKAMLGELGLKAGQIDELRKMPAERILKAQSAILSRISTMSFANRRRLGFNPVVDGEVLPGNPFAPAAPAISVNVPLMIGTNKDEMTLFFGFAPWLDSIDENSLRNRAGMIAGDSAEGVIEAYRRARPGAAAKDIFLAMATDVMMRVPSLITADRKTEQKAAPAYVYLFTWESPVLGGKLKSCHALEIPFVFDTLAATGLTGDGAERMALADKMSRAWLAFAHSGSPNHAGIPQWPAYSTRTRPTMIFDRECKIANDPLGEERKAWMRG